MPLNATTGATSAVTAHGTGWTRPVSRTLPRGWMISTCTSYEETCRQSPSVSADEPLDEHRQGNEASRNQPERAADDDK